MQACITVKGKPFQHQFLYTGNGDERRCHFCQLAFPTQQDFMKALEEEGDYSGQSYFHKTNPNIKATEERWHHRIRKEKR